MASRFQDMTSSLTPPTSDRGDCEDFNVESFLPETFYPSPAPSILPDLGRDSCEIEEDSIFFTPNTSLSHHSMYTGSMPYPSYDELSAWAQPYNNFPNNVSLFPYSVEEQSNLFTTYMTQQAPATIIPPVPQELSGGSFNFNDLVVRPQATNFLRSHSTSSALSPAAPSSISFDDMSSRSRSPSLSLPADSELQDRRKTSFASQRSSTSSLHAYGIPIRSSDSSTVQAWKCAFPNCTSRAVFTRGCDLRKHYNRHSKHLFCRVDGCPQSEAACVTITQQEAIQAGLDASDPSKLAVSGGFSSKKDRARHEAKHSPSIRCTFPDCSRVFSRMDNMQDHCRRIHHKGQSQQQPQQASNKKSLQ